MVVYTDIPEVSLLHRGKVRDIYDLGENLLIVATDRISAYDVVLPTPIPDKGKILTKLTLFWLEFLMDISENHLITAKVDEYPGVLQSYRSLLEGRSMIVKKAKVFPIECIVRGYLTGSALKEYKPSGKVCGISLPLGLHEADKLPEPIFTPSTKAKVGSHDINITFEQMMNIVGKENALYLKEVSLKLYQRASFYAEERGIIIADTKFEFGLHQDRVILVDEVLTPDSSRFWLKVDYEPGKPQVSFDKQYIRDWLKSTGWTENDPPPEIPTEVVEKTREKYLLALRLLTGETL